MSETTHVVAGNVIPPPQKLEVVLMTIHGYFHLVLRATVGGEVRHFSLAEIDENGMAVAWPSTSIADDPSADPTLTHPAVDGPPRPFPPSTRLGAH